MKTTFCNEQRLIAAATLLFSIAAFAALAIYSLNEQVNGLQWRWLLAAAMLASVLTLLLAIGATLWAFDCRLPTVRLETFLRWHVGNGNASSEFTVLGEAHRTSSEAGCETGVVLVEWANGAGERSHALILGDLGRLPKPGSYRIERDALSSLHLVASNW